MTTTQLLRREGPTAHVASVASLADTAFFVDLAGVVVSLLTFALIGTDSDGWIRRADRPGLYPLRAWLDDPEEVRARRPPRSSTSAQSGSASS